jgi:hypothetical protein
LGGRGVTKVNPTANSEKLVNKNTIKLEKNLMYFEFNIFNTMDYLLRI